MSGHRVICGDCLDPVTGLASLAAGSVDHFITDPPYSRDLYLRFRTNGGAHRGDGYQTANHLAMANLAIGACDDVIAAIVPQMTRTARRWLLVFHDAESGHLWRAALGDLHVRAGVWVKPNPMPQVSGDRPAQGFEALEIAHPVTAKRWNGGGRPAVWVCNAVNANPAARVGNDHPCPKPLPLMEALIRDFTDPGDLVCDPFAGSGTTGVACKRLGRRFIGWERNPVWAEAAQKRIDGAREQLSFAVGWNGARTPRARNLDLKLEGDQETP